MGNESSTLSGAEARHLLRRTGFDVPAKTVARWMAAGITRGEAADELLLAKPKGVKLNGKSFEAIHDKWVKFLLKTKAALQEKLVLFWHDHFATGISKVGDPVLMARQNALFREHCKGNFKTLVNRVNTDAATMEYLDTVRNTAGGLNENYARELQELFTLGVKDVSGNDNYLQEDIVEIARAFTGWRYNDKGEAYFVPDLHDFGGPKVIYKHTGQFGPAGADFSGASGLGGIGNVIDVILQHRDTQGYNTVARRIARRLIEFFGTANPAQTFVDDVVGTGTDAFDATWLVSGLLRRLFTHDDFYLGAGAPGTTSHKSIAWPIDYVVTTLRTLNMKTKGKDMLIAGGNYLALRDHLTGMGQTLFDPPSVFGWDWESNWISSATLLARYVFVRDVTSARDGGSSAFRPEKFVDLKLTDADAIVDAVLAACGVADAFDGAERAVLATYLTDGAGPIDLLNDDYRSQKLHGLFALVLKSPAYQLV